MSFFCGAKTKSKGTPCKRYVPEKGKRCHVHGGASTGPKTPEGKAKSKMNGTTHGFYVKGHTPEEIEYLKEYHRKEERETLDAELDVARILLRRAWIIAGEALGVEDPTEGLELVESKQTSEESTSSTVSRRRAEIIRKRPDLWLIVDRCLSRVGRLVEQKAKIMEVRELQGELDRIRERLPQL